jgi:hypothetical protein
LKTFESNNHFSKKELTLTIIPINCNFATLWNVDSGYFKVGQNEEGRLILCRGTIPHFQMVNQKHFKTISKTLDHPILPLGKKRVHFWWCDCIVKDLELSSHSIIMATTCIMCGLAPIYFDSASNVVRATTSCQPEINWSDTATRLQDPQPGLRTKSAITQSK